MRRLLASCLFSASVVLAGAAHASPPSVPEGVRAEPVPFSAVPGWKADDHAKAWRVWLASCASQAKGDVAASEGVPVPASLASACRDALKLGPVNRRTARLFFEKRFAAWRIVPDSGRAFYTGYYEPEIRGSLVREGPYQTPILDRPGDLLTFGRDTPAPAGFEGYKAARINPDGSLGIYPDRKAIEDGALAGKGLEIGYVSDPVDFFFMQIQGSARIRLPGGSVVRYAYAGKNGQPYSAIGKAVAARLKVPPAEITMARLRSFLRADPVVAREVMQENKSFIFFRVAPFTGKDAGPIGGEGLPVTPLRSIAIDRKIWPYGLPVFVQTAIPDVVGVAPRPIRSLMIAQDTGSAIIGAARADIFFGSGHQAGAVAGAVRHGGQFVVLWPRGDDPS